MSQYRIISMYELSDNTNVVKHIGQAITSSLYEV